MGETRDQAICAARPEDCVGLYLRRDLSGQRKRRRARPTLLQQRGHALHLEEISLAVATGAHALVLLDQAGWHVSKELPVPGKQYDPRSIAARVTRVEPSRKYLAVHARQLALEPGFQILRRHPQSLLLRLEQAHRYALENYVHRNKRMGLSVVISETWYYSKPKPPITRRQQRSSYRCSNRRRIEQTCAAWVGQGSRGHCHVRPRRARPLALRIYWRTHLSKSHQAFRTSALQTWREVVAA
jgi:hypothetical protein